LKASRIRTRDLVQALHSCRFAPFTANRRQWRKAVWGTRGPEFESRPRSRIYAGSRRTAATRSGAAGPHKVHKRHERRKFCPAKPRNFALVSKQVLWRRVRQDYERMVERAPEGFEPLVQVYLAGREAPIDLGWVTTRKGSDEPWWRFESEPPKGATAEDEKLPAEQFWVHVHESAILRVEIIFRRKLGTSVGFHLNDEATDLDSPDET
jgi:hypothetical protein